jgi:L-asparaginase/Glu-tRNA(Gln) amidotransferase subunit D
MSYAGADGRLIRSLTREGDVQGLVIAGFGLGGVTGQMFDAIPRKHASREYPLW